MSSFSRTVNRSAMARGAAMRGATALPKYRSRTAAAEKTQAITWSGLHSLLVLLMAAVLVSMLSLIYFKDLNRRLFIQYQQAEHISRQMNVEQGRLLLEQSAWSTQSRVQVIAQQMQMTTPGATEVEIVSGR